MDSAGLAPDAFRLLGDDVRLRILRLLAREHLNGTELTRILGLAQSGVSRHLGLLRDGGLVEEVREGGWSSVRLAATPPAGLTALWPALRAELGHAPDAHGDDARLAVVRREREERRVGWARGGGAKAEAEPGRSWSAWARALGHLMPALDVADLGCGEGALTLEVARWAGHVIGVDPAPARLERAREAADRMGAENTIFVHGTLDALPVEDASRDVALLSQVLHALPEPSAAVEEASRVLRPGGRVLVMDLLPHRESWVKERLGHRWLGFQRDDVAAWFEAAGLVGVRCEEAARRRGNPFTVLVASARKPLTSETHGGGSA